MHFALAYRIQMNCDGKKAETGIYKDKLEVLSSAYGLLVGDHLVTIETAE